MGGGTKLDANDVDQSIPNKSHPDRSKLELQETTLRGKESKSRAVSIGSQRNTYF